MPVVLRLSPEMKRLLRSHRLCLVLHHVRDLRTSELDFINLGGKRSPAKPEAHYS